MRSILTNDSPVLIWPDISGPREIQFYPSEEPNTGSTHHLTRHFLHSSVQYDGRGGDRGGWSGDNLPQIVTQYCSIQYSEVCSLVTATTL